MPPGGDTTHVRRGRAPTPTPAAARRTAEAVARYGLPVRGACVALAGQIAQADARYDEALTRIPALAVGGAAIRAAASTYREILRQREGLGARGGRVVVPGRRNLVLPARSVTATRPAAPVSRRPSAAPRSRA